MINFLGHSSREIKSYRENYEGTWNRSRGDGSSNNSFSEKYWTGKIWAIFNENLNKILQSVSVYKKLKSSRSEDSESIGRWATYIKKRIEIDELRREFNGWTGHHERHCILHDVFTMWIFFLIFSFCTN